MCLIHSFLPCTVWAFPNLSQTYLNSLNGQACCYILEVLQLFNWIITFLAKINANTGSFINYSFLLISLTHAKWGWWGTHTSRCPTQNWRTAMFHTSSSFYKIYKPCSACFCCCGFIQIFFSQSYCFVFVHIIVHTKHSESIVLQDKARLCEISGSEAGKNLVSQNVWYFANTCSVWVSTNKRDQTGENIQLCLPQNEKKKILSSVSTAQFYDWLVHGHASST